MTLKEELNNWISDNRNSETLGDDLWDFLQERIGPVQEKLINDIEMLRAEKHQLTRKLEAFIDELSRVQQRKNFEDS